MISPAITQRTSTRSESSKPQAPIIPGNLCAVIGPWTQCFPPRTATALSAGTWQATQRCQDALWNFIGLNLQSEIQGLVY